MLYVDCNRRYLISFFLLFFFFFFKGMDRTEDNDSVFFLLLFFFFRQSASPSQQIITTSGCFLFCFFLPLPGWLRDKDPELVAVLLRQPDESLLGLWRRADLLAERGDHLRVQSNGLSSQLVQVFQSHHRDRYSHGRGEDAVLEGQVFCERAWWRSFLLLSLLQIWTK